MFSRLITCVCVLVIPKCCKWGMGGRGGGGADGKSLTMQITGGERVGVGGEEATCVKALFSHIKQMDSSE